MRLISVTNPCHKKGEHSLVALLAQHGTCNAVASISEASNQSAPYLRCKGNGLFSYLSTRSCAATQAIGVSNFIDLWCNRLFFLCLDNQVLHDSFTRPIRDPKGKLDERLLHSRAVARILVMITSLIGREHMLTEVAFEF